MNDALLWCFHVSLDVATANMSVISHRLLFPDRVSAVPDSSAIQRYLTKDTSRSLVQAFVHMHCWPNNCNALLVRTADIQIKRLQLVQDTADLVSGARPRDHNYSNPTQHRLSSGATELIVFRIAILV